MNRREILGTFAAAAAGGLALPALAAGIADEPPPETEVRFPIDPLPRPVNSNRQLLNLRWVTTYVSLYINDGIDIAMDQRQLQISFSMSTRHRKGFGIPLQFVSARVTIGRIKWDAPLTINDAVTSVGAIYASNINGPTVPASSLANITLNYLVKGRKKSLQFRDVMVFSPLIVPG
ncbi:MAG: hypothetical protein NTV94_02015 [Planctomycetota bacterium]|nr:hypothetical protein [Planctomycetota bacterium]